MNASILAWLLGVLAAGVAMVVWGLRGRRINDHPVCRQCRFDLSGQPEPTITCPECGAGLKREGSVRKGQRRKRPIAIALGSLAVVLPILAIGAIAFALLTGTDLNSYKPLGLLAWEARRTDAAKSKLIGAELHKRMQAKGVAPDRYKRIVQTALAFQGDTLRPWSSAWGDIIEQADTDGKLSTEDQSRYRRQAAVLKFETRPRVCISDDVPVLATLKEARIGTSGAFWGMSMLEAATVGGQKARRARQRLSFPGDESPLGVSTFGMNAAFDQGPHLGMFQMYGAGNRMGWGGQSFGQAGLMLELPRGTAAGVSQVSVSLGLKLVEQQGGRYTWPNGLKKDDPDTSMHRADLRVEVLPAGEKGLEIVAPTPEVEKKLSVLLEPVNIMAYRFDKRQPPQLHLTVKIEGRPVDFAFDVIVKTPEGQWKLSPLTSGRLPSDQSYQGPGMEESRQAFGMLRGFTAKTADFIFKPSEAVALQTVDVVRMYGGEIAFKNVEIRWQDDQFGGVAAPAPSGKGSWSGLLKLLGL